ncbi:MAG: polysaccharide biosynthesis protein [Methylotenera sp.]|nr:polysaccharide biosynthesis protein [Oligoflexia bacterium]
MYKLSKSLPSRGSLRLKDLIDRRRFTDFVGLLSSGVLSWVLVFGVSDLKNHWNLVIPIALTRFFMLLPVFRKERHWRNVSAYEAVKFVKAVALSSAMIMVAAFIGSKKPGIFSWLIVDSLTAVGILCAMRLSVRFYVEDRQSKISKLNGRPTLIYGTGSAAQSFARRFSMDSSLGVRLVGFIDDDPSQLGADIGGVPVIGGLSELESILKSHGIQELIIAKSVGDGEILGKILQISHSLKIRPKMVSELGLTQNQDEKSGLFREINLLDLLQRPRVEVDLTSTVPLISGRVVLVSGGGGSIGSELIRQIIKMTPSKVLILDHSEFNLYEIETEMRRMGYAERIVPILSDLKEPLLLSQLMNLHRPECIFHAAAYKHVHLVEANQSAAIINNLLTLKNLIDCSIAHSVECFVLISSDKAVNPKGIMGYTKRACELMVTQAAKQSGKRYCSVRFGNVLGSSGSFIPLLRKQISEGGPVTITHEEMERYFMLIPEAVSLVLKAASISSPGDINVLRMGESIKILNVARSLICLMGKSEDSVPIIFTGMRPGEKLREELYLTGDELCTLHPDILVLPRGDRLPKYWHSRNNSISIMVEIIISLARSGDERASEIMRTFVEQNDRDSNGQIQGAVENQSVKGEPNRVA